MDKLFLCFPQWQGTGGNEVYMGTNFLCEMMGEYDFIEVPVIANERLEKKNLIWGYDSIVNQLRNAHDLVDKSNPSRIFTIGGGCDIEIVPVAYLNDFYTGDLDIIWIDAHADLNTPQTSPSGNFHGMPLRTLLGDGDIQILKMIDRPLVPDQVILLGTRDLDEPEEKYIEQNGIRKFEFETVKLTDLKEKIYVHVDLDVLDPGEFGMVKVPTPGGAAKVQLLEFLRKLSGSKKIIGGSVVEFTGNSLDDAKFVGEALSIIQS